MRALRLSSPALRGSAVGGCALAAGLLSACTTTTYVVNDGGPPIDAPIARPDVPPPPPLACDGELMVLNGVLGETATLTFDTSMTAERPRDLGLGCGNAETTAAWANQEVIEYHVPGTGPVGVSFDTAVTGTAANFNTLVQVRETCGDVPLAYPPTCFDDDGDEARASGGFFATGGDIVYLIVTAYSDPEAVSGEVDEGPLTIELTATADTPPTVDDGSVFLLGDAMLVDVTARDAEGPPFAYALSLFTAAGQLDFNGDGVREPSDSLIFRFDDVTGTSPYLAIHDITPMDDGYTLAAYCRTNMCTQAGIVVFDESWAASEVFMVPVMSSMTVGIGATCDRHHPCGTGSTCTGDVCVLTPAAVAECAAATPIVIDMPVDATATTALVTGNITAGTGVFVGSCTNGDAPATAHRGREGAYSIELTGTGPYDLTVSTAVTGTAPRDTIVYVRSVCGDETEELGCTDDNPAIMTPMTPGNLQSTVRLTDLEPGTYWVFVELYNAAAGAYALEATLSLAD